MDDLEKSRRWRRTDQSAAEERSRSRHEEKAKNAVLQRLITQKGEGRGSSQRTQNQTPTLGTVDNSNMAQDLSSVGKLLDYYRRVTNQAKRDQQRDPKEASEVFTKENTLLESRIEHPTSEKGDYVNSLSKSMANWMYFHNKSKREMGTGASEETQADVSD